MAIYSLSILTVTTSSASAAWEIIPGTKAYRLLEFGVFNNAATASIFGLGNPAAIGVTPTSPITFLNESEASGRAATVTAATAWGTAPTVPTNFWRRGTTPAAIGGGLIWQFPRGIQVLTATSLVLWNLQLNTAFQAYAVVEE